MELASSIESQLVDLELELIKNLKEKELPELFEKKELLKRKIHEFFSSYGILSLYTKSDDIGLRLPLVLYSPLDELEQKVRLFLFELEK